MSRKFAVVALLVLSIASMSFGAATFQINNTGTVYATLEEAFGIAVAGDTINATVGEYTMAAGTTFFWNKAVSLVGSGSNSDPLLGTVIKGGTGGLGLAIRPGASGVSAAAKTTFSNFNFNLMNKRPGFSLVDAAATSGTPNLVQNIKLDNISMVPGGTSAKPEALYTSTSWLDLQNWEINNLDLSAFSGSNLTSYGLNFSENVKIDGMSITNSKFNAIKRAAIKMGGADALATVNGFQSFKNVTIANNQFNGNSGWTSIWMQVGGPGSALQNIVVKNNQFTDNTTALGAPRDTDVLIAFRGTEGTASNIQFKGNTFTHTGARAGVGNAIYVNNFDAAAAPTQLTNIAAAGNTFTGYAAAFDSHGFGGTDLGAASPRVKIGKSGNGTAGAGAVTLLPGDKDFNGSVSFTDAYNTILAKGTVTTGGWAAGDFDLTGTVDLGDAYQAVLNKGQPAIIPATTPGVADDAKLTLIYDAVTGVVTMNKVGPAANVMITSDGNKLIGANANVPAGALGAELTAGLIGWLSFSDLNYNGHVLGAILPAGLTEAQALADLTINFTLTGNPTDQTGDLIWVPEPATLSLLGLGGLLAIRRRRA